jgi:hypothetical protein
MVANYRRWNLFAHAAVVGCLVVATSGCGNGLARVSGQVTLDDQPLAGGQDVRGTVYFYPEAGTGAPAVGLLDSSGKYSLNTGTKKGIKPGAYKVTISATRIIAASQAGEAPSGRPITPRHYADPAKSGFRVDVSKGSNTFDFALESNAKPTR